MSKTQHTPGPWRLARHDAWDTNPFSITVHKRGTTTVANIPRRNQISTEEQAANARLIAASPAMLEALQDLAAYFGPTPDVDNGLDEILTTARAAIKQATEGE